MMIPRGRVRHHTQSRRWGEHTRVDRMCMCLVNGTGEAVAVSDTRESKPSIQQSGIKVEIGPVLRLWCAVLLNYCVWWGRRVLGHSKEQRDRTCLTEMDEGLQSFSERACMQHIHIIPQQIPTAKHMNGAAKNFHYYTEVQFQGPWRGSTRSRSSTTSARALPK